MIDKAIHRLQYLCDTLPPLLLKIPEHEFTYKRSPEKWSKKQILGHLIDSAANNHQRFVRVQFEETPFIVYDQDNWNNASRYNEMPATHVIALWAANNRHIIEIIKRIPAEALSRLCKTSEPEPVTLQWLIEDYIKHMEYHLKQITTY